MTAMKDDNASERAAALVHQAIEVLQRAGSAPSSPVNTFLTAKLRRQYRRGAQRLRRHQSQPRYRNLHTSEELADVYERTVRRDEILEQGVRDLLRITLDLGRVLEENGPEVRETIDTLVTEAKRAAKEQGPGSEAAQRYRQLLVLGWLGQRYHSRKRRQRSPGPPRVSPVPDGSIEARYEATAAEVLLASPSSGEAILSIPPDGRDAGRGRLLLRIGLGEAAWIGSFARGHMTVSTIGMMPDGKHLFVSADGAGYVIDLKSRTLVEETGTHVAGVMRDEASTVFVVDHDGLVLEAFGRSGRLWKTEPIGCGGFRGMAIADDGRLIGEARQSSPPGWAPFSVILATGEVRSGL
jgi:hypothetical protein